MTDRTEKSKSRGGRPGLPVPNGPYGLYGRKLTLNLNRFIIQHGWMAESASN